METGKQREMVPGHQPDWTVSVSLRFPGRVLAQWRTKLHGESEFYVEPV